MDSKGSPSHNAPRVRRKPTTEKSQQAAAGSPGRTPAVTNRPRPWATRARTKKKPKIATEQFKGISFGTMLRCISFARRWGNYFREKRAAARARARLEPTYRLEPVKPFQSFAVTALLEKLLEERLAGVQYSPKMSAILCRALSEEIKDLVKKLGYDRYKYVVVVNIGECTEQGADVTSRCLWDTCRDSSASASVVSGNMFSSVQVFAAYSD